MFFGFFCGEMNDVVKFFVYVIFGVIGLGWCEIFVDFIGDGFDIDEYVVVLFFENEFVDECDVVFGWIVCWCLFGVEVGIVVLEDVIEGVMYVFFVMDGWGNLVD